MADEKDWFEIIKRKHSKHQLSGTVTEYEAFDRLIQEVEKLRDEIEGLNEDEFGRKL